MSAEVTARAGELARLHRDVPVQRYRSLLGHWLARWFRPPRPATLEPLPALGPGQLSLSFGGHATVLLRFGRPAEAAPPASDGPRSTSAVRSAAQQGAESPHDEGRGGSPATPVPSKTGLAIAFDPMLGRWIGGVRRAVEPGLAPGDFSDVRLILISHRHADHLHLPTLKKMPRAATIAVPAGAAAWVSPLGFARVVELRPGSDLEIRGVHVIAAPISHGDHELAGGLSYVVRGDGPSVFLCGDSGYFSGFAHVGERYAPDIAVLPIGGFLPTSFRARHMSPLDALFAFEDLRARLLVPIHHGAFALSYEQLDEPVRWLIELAKERGLRDHVHVMTAGQSERFAAEDVIGSREAC